MRYAMRRRWCDVCGRRQHLHCSRSQGVGRWGSRTGRTWLVRRGEGRRARRARREGKMESCDNLLPTPAPHTPRLSHFSASAAPLGDPPAPYRHTRASDSAASPPRLASSRVLPPAHQPWKHHCYDNTSHFSFVCTVHPWTPVAMRLIPPITPAEFLYHLQRCIPPTGWRPSIG